MSFACTDTIKTVFLHEGVTIHKSKYEYSKFGITEKYLIVYNKKNNTNYQIKTLTIEQAQKIANDLLVKSKIKKINSLPIRKQTFDILYNAGNRGLTAVQLAINDYYGYQKVKVDGVIGTRSLEAINKIKRIKHFNQLIINRRIKYYQQLPNWYLYKNGWTKRIYSFRMSTTEQK